MPKLTPEQKAQKSSFDKAKFNADILKNKTVQILKGIRKLLKDTKAGTVTQAQIDEVYTDSSWVNHYAIQVTNHMFEHSSKHKEYEANAEARKAS